MIVQVNAEKGHARIHPVPKTRDEIGFYRVMILSPLIDGLPAYWMYNGTWHTRHPPHLNPPPPWTL